MKEDILKKSLSVTFLQIGTIHELEGPIILRMIVVIVWKDRDVYLHKVYPW